MSLGKLRKFLTCQLFPWQRIRATLRVMDQGEPSEPAIGGSGENPKSNDRERWNDYGIGLFLQGDLKGAEAVFLKVTEIEPTYMDGWVNVARCRHSGRRYERGRTNA